nr:MAG TPA: hypothetical protein [Caudoviricetes sp.]
MLLSFITPSLSSFKSFSKCLKKSIYFHVGALSYSICFIASFNTSSVGFFIYPITNGFFFIASNCNSSIGLSIY